MASSSVGMGSPVAIASAKRPSSASTGRRSASIPTRRGASVACCSLHNSAARVTTSLTRSSVSTSSRARPCARRQASRAPRDRQDRGDSRSRRPASSLHPPGGGVPHQSARITTTTAPRACSCRRHISAYQTSAVRLQADRDHNFSSSTAGPSPTLTLREPVKRNRRPPKRVGRGYGEGQPAGAGGARVPGAGPIVRAYVTWPRRDQGSPGAAGGSEAG
jgi:hypothetical protein